MISLAEIFSNKNIKRPAIVAFFFNSSGAVWTAGPQLPRLLIKSIRGRSLISPKRKKIGGGPVQRRYAP